ncbi:MAG: hypothetical protein M9921_13905 [Fimbriimonadaceae bacterium]|nr:hypothetical protein [Fimbriimonadaceae bacterium]
MLLAPLLLFVGLPSAPVDLSRVFAKGEKGQYAVKSAIQVESRGPGLLSWIPEDLGIQYKFTYAVTEMKADGIAVVHYERPTMTWIEGETFNTPETKRVEKVDMKLDATLSPINELLELKDLNPGKKPPPAALDRAATPGAETGPEGAPQDVIEQFVGEIHRLALFLGAIDSSLDFSPKLPYDLVNPGDTWKRTVGYSPQALAGKGGQLAVQRLDYTYTYKGPVEVEGKRYQRVDADLSLDTDLAQFVNQLMDTKPEQSGLKQIPLRLKATIEFDLDLQTRRTVRATAKSEGGFSVVVTQRPNEPVYEERFKGTTTLSLVAG